MHENTPTDKTLENKQTQGTQGNYPLNRFSVAPMLDWTDRHCRYFFRQLTKNTLLYTEMVTTGAIIHGKGDYLKYSNEEHPISLQLGGSQSTSVSAMCKIGTRAWI
ncbi:tRNA-dihydrouridine synthase [Proteus mirabilis]